MRPSRILPLSSFNSFRSLPLIVPLLVIFTAAAACSSPPAADFQASDEGGPVPHEVSFAPLEEKDGVTYSWEFGDGTTSDENTPTHTYEDAGAFTVRLTASRGGSQGVSEQPMTIEPGEAGWITVEPASLVMESGERSQLTASAFDALGNPVPDVEFTWTSSERAGSVLEDGTVIGGPEVGSFTEAVTVEYERLGATATATVPVEIVYGGLDSISVQPPVIDLRVNNRVDIHVTARDKQGHVLPEPEIDWNVERIGVDTVLAGGEFRAGLVPTNGEQELLTVRVVIGNSTRAQTLSGSITTGILDRVDVTSSAEQVPVGVPVSLSAEAFDRFGNQLQLDTVEWELVSDSYGEVTEDGVFTPSGNAVNVDGPLVTAIGELDRVRSYADVTLDVLPGNASAITLFPQVDSIPVGAGNPYLAVVTDEFGNEIEDIDVQWSVTGGGAITDQGVFIAGFETGEFPGAVVATVLAGAGGNLTQITATADVVIRDRSSNMLAVEVSNTTDAGIILINLTNGDLLSLSTELDNDAGIEVSPTWWPDGSRLAYVSDVSGLPQIYDIDVETGDIRQLVDDPDGSAMPAISPDGTKLAYVVTAGDNWQLYVADLPVPDSEGNITPITREQATKLSANDDEQALLPWWSPDGSAIAFTASRTASDVNVNIVPSDGSSEPMQLSDVGYSAFGWSEGGEGILAVDNLSGGEQNLLVLSSETGEVIGFVPLPFQAFLVSWAPDSSEAAVIDRVTGSLWLIDSDGTSLRQALDSSLVPRRTAWRPVPIDTAAVLAEQESASAE